MLRGTVEWQASGFTQTPLSEDGLAWACSGVTNSKLTILIQYVFKDCTIGTGIGLDLQDVELARI